MISNNPTSGASQRNPWGPKDYVALAGMFLTAGGASFYVLFKLGFGGAPDKIVPSLMLAVAVGLLGVAVGIILRDPGDFFGESGSAAAWIPVIIMVVLAAALILFGL